jgi:hypothetical protein
MDEVIHQLKSLEVDLHRDSVIIIVNRIVSANPRYYQDEGYKTKILSKAKQRYDSLPEEVKKARSEKAKQRYRDDAEYRTKVLQRSKDWFKNQKAKASQSVTTVNLQIS